jgi:hypothetical protein
VSVFTVAYRRVHQIDVHRITRQQHHVDTFWPICRCKWNAAGPDVLTFTTYDEAQAFGRLHMGHSWAISDIGEIAVRRELYG